MQAEPSSDLFRMLLQKQSMAKCEAASQKSQPSSTSPSQIQTDNIEIRKHGCKTNGHRELSPDVQSAQQHFVAGRLFSVIPGRLSFTVHHNDDQTAHEIRTNPRLFFFSTDLQERYAPFCADFGPVNLGVVVHFCDYLRSIEEDKRLANRHLVYYCANDTESVSNTAFLLSTHLMLQHNMTPQQAVAPFTNVLGLPVVPFRDPTYTKSTFPISILDCLRGLRKAVELGWFKLEEFDLDAYEDLDDPSRGDMHRICPKFVALRGPEDPRHRFEDTGAPTPELAIQMLLKLKVSTTIRLNAPDMYDRSQFLASGMRHVDLFFEDCTTPSDDLVSKFMEEAEKADVIAVHCLAGLGRTGTMIGLWLMAKHGFSAREAIAWMRIVRPGCVIGPQQHYLEWMEGRLNDGSFPTSASARRGGGRCGHGATPGFEAPSGALAERLAAQVRRAIALR